MPEPTNQVTITLTGVSATGYHGVFPEERKQGQTFIVDASLRVITDGDDQVAGTLDYGTVANQIVAQISGQPVDLIETLAARIADELIDNPRVRTATITVHKPQAPLRVPFADVAVTLTRSRA